MGLQGPKSERTVKTTATTYCHNLIYGLVFLRQRRFGVYVLYQTVCYLGVVGKQKTLQVNKLLACARVWFVFRSLSSLFPSLPFHCGRLHTHHCFPLPFPLPPIEPPFSPPPTPRLLAAQLQ